MDDEEALPKLDFQKWIFQVHRFEIVGLDHWNEFLVTHSEWLCDFNHLIKFEIT